MIVEKAKLYWSSVEYHYKTGKSDSKNLTGGFVYVFLKTFDARTALKRILEELELMELTPIEIEFVSPYDINTEWDTEEQTKKIMTICNNGFQNTDIVFDTFHAYEVE